MEQFANKSGIAINVTVFERNPYVGGRTTTVNAYGNPLEPVELGGSIFVEVNAILKNASALFGLQPKEYISDTEILGIWNGETFVYTQKDSGWKYWDIAKLLWKYGLAPIRTQRLAKSIVNKFLKLYEFPFFPFRSLSDRALDLDLISVTSQTGEQFLAANGVGIPADYLESLLTFSRLELPLQLISFRQALESTMPRILLLSMAWKPWFACPSKEQCRLKVEIGKYSTTC